MSPNQVIATNTLPTSIHSQKCSTQGNETGEIKVYKTNLTVLCHLTKLLLQTHCLQVYTAKNVWVQNLFQVPAQGCVMVNVSCLSN